MNRRVIREAIDSFDFETYIDQIFSKVHPTTKEYRVRTYCPFCGETKGRFYIHIPARLVYCQVCKYDPKWLPKFIADYEGLRLDDVIIALLGNEYIGDKKSVEDIVESLFLSQEEEDFEYAGLKLEPTFFPLWEEEKTGFSHLDKLIDDARGYLRFRGLELVDIERYRIHYAWDGKFKNRVIVPAFIDNKLVTFVARSLDKNPFIKYMTPEGNDQAECLFNYDSVVGDTVVIAEGVFDVISIADSVVGTFGKSLSARQIAMLNKFKNKIFYWDKDAYQQLNRYISDGGLTGNIRVVLQPDSRDAGDRSYQENQKLINSAVGLKSIDYLMYGI